MSTQDSSAIPFDICHDQQTFRLLELPPNLLEAITSSHPPNLLLKSTALEAKNNSTATNHAVLCTDDRTFHIRQVNSSNSIFILQPSQTYSVGEEKSIPVDAISAIAQPTAMLELIPSSYCGPLIMRQILPIYGISQAESETDFADRTSKYAALDDLPLSSAEFEAFWIQLCAFEHEGQAWLPKATVLVGVWKSIISAATANSMDLAQSFRTQDVMELVREDGFPVPLIEAVVRRIRSDDDDLMEGYAIIDKDKCVQWVGVIILESRSTSEGLKTSDLLRDWKGQLPEAWRELASLDAIKEKYHNIEKDRIAFNDGTNKIDISSSSSAANAGGKRLGKWHEKFKNARR